MVSHLDVPFQHHSALIQNAVKQERMALWGLGLFSALTLLVPVAIKGRVDIPKPMIAVSLGLSAIASGAAGAIAHASAQKQTIYQGFQAVQQTFVKDSLEQQAAAALANQEFAYKWQLFQRMMAELPPALWNAYIHEHYLEQFRPVADQYLAQLMPAPEPEAVPGYPDAIPVQAIAESLPVAPKPTVPKDTSLPDGAPLVGVKELQDINRYPVVMVIANMGEGKTTTLNWLLRRMDGLRVFVSPDAKQPDFARFEKVFGAYGDYGDADELMTLDENDLTKLGKKGSIVEFLWGTYREVKNRQQLEKSEIAKLPIYRCFFDEAASTYSSMDKAGKELMQKFNQECFFNSRKHRIQLWFGAQSESVDLIGMKSLSSTRDDMWHLYPKYSAINCCKKFEHEQLAKYLESRLNDGYAVAVLERKGEIHVLNLPTVKEMVADDEAVSAEPSPTPSQKPTPSASGWLEALEAQLSERPTMAQVKALYEAMTGQTLNEKGLDYLLEILRDRGWDIAEN